MNFKKILFTFFVLLILYSCTKKHLNEPGTENYSNSDLHVNNKPRANASVLFYSYESNKDNGNGMLATTNAMSEISDFSFQPLTPTRPKFHVFNKTTGELWGIRYSKQFNKKALTRYALSKKTFTDTDIFPLDSLDREIIKVDDSQLYYLEGFPSSLGFFNLIRCNHDGSNKIILHGSNGDIIAATISGTKIYYVSKGLNALVEKKIGSNTTKILIKNFNLAGAKQFVDFKKVKIANKDYWSIQRVENAIDERRLNLFNIDIANNKIFWLRDATGVIPVINNQPENIRYNMVRPDLVCSKLDGTGFTVLNAKFTSVLGAAGKKGDIEILWHGGLQIDPVGKKLYFGIEKMIKGTNTPESPFPGDIIPEKGFYRIFNIYQTDYLGNNAKKLLKANAQEIIYPLQWESFITNDIIDWPYTDDVLFKGSLESFILGNLNR